MLSRMRGQHRRHILLKAERATVLRAAATRALEVRSRRSARAPCVVVADIDPYEVL
jgi:primosomal protein N'